MIVLDTNVISELMRPQPDSQEMAWANGLDPQAIAITAMNEAEICEQGNLMAASTARHQHPAR